MRSPQMKKLEVEVHCHDGTEEYYFYGANTVQDVSLHSLHSRGVCDREQVRHLVNNVESQAVKNVLTRQSFKVR